MARTADTVGSVKRVVAKLGCAARAARDGDNTIIIAQSLFITEITLSYSRATPVLFVCFLCPHPHNKIEIKRLLKVRLREK